MEESVPPGSACCFCLTTYEDEALYGKFYKIEEITTHYFCLLLSSKVQQRGSDNEGILGFLPLDIRNEIRRGKNVVCAYCGKRGATISCHYSKCRMHFHLPCGRLRDTFHQFFGEFKSFCCKHRKSQRIKQAVLKAMSGKESTCSICLESVPATPSPSTLWAPCCSKEAWFHRVCIQRLALSAGYFFKCPLCNNTAQFVESMRTCGIWIPEQDASWERDPERYEGLLQRHNSCDAKSCRCRQGRTFHLENTKWEIKLCLDCGSQGMHVHCGNLRVTQDWICSVCSSVTTQKGALLKAGKISRARGSLSMHTSVRSSLPPRPTQRATRRRQPQENEEDEEDDVPLSAHATSGEDGKRRRLEVPAPKVDKETSSVPQKDAFAASVPDSNAQAREAKQEERSQTQQDEGSDLEIIENSDDEIQHGRDKKRESLVCSCEWRNQSHCSRNVHSPDRSGVSHCCYDRCKKYIHFGKPSSSTIKPSENLVSRFYTLTSFSEPPLVKGQQPLCQLWIIHCHLSHSERRYGNCSTSWGSNQDSTSGEESKMTSASTSEWSPSKIPKVSSPEEKAEYSTNAYHLRRSTSCHQLNQTPNSFGSSYHLRSSEHSSSRQQLVEGIITSAGNRTSKNSSAITCSSEGRSAVTSQIYRAKSEPRLFEFDERTFRSEESQSVPFRVRTRSQTRSAAFCMSFHNYSKIPSQNNSEVNSERSSAHEKRSSSTFGEREVHALQIQRSVSPCRRRSLRRTGGVAKSCCSKVEAHTNQTKEIPQDKRKRYISHGSDVCSKRGRSTSRPDNSEYVVSLANHPLCKRTHSNNSASACESEQIIPNTKDKQFSVRKKQVNVNVGNGIELSKLASFQPVVVLEKLENEYNASGKYVPDQIGSWKGRRSRHDQFTMSKLLKAGDVKNSLRKTHHRSTSRKTQLQKRSASQTSHVSNPIACWKTRRSRRDQFTISKQLQAVNRSNSQREIPCTRAVSTSSRTQLQKRSASRASNAPVRSPIRTRSSSRSNPQIIHKSSSLDCSKRHTRSSTDDEYDFVSLENSSLIISETFEDCIINSASTDISSSDETDDEVYVSAETNVHDITSMIANISKLGPLVNKDIGSVLPKNGSLFLLPSASHGGDYNAERFSSTEESSSTSVHPISLPSPSCSPSDVNSNSPMSCSPIPFPCLVPTYSPPPPADSFTPSSTLLPLASTVVVPSKSNIQHADCSQKSSSPLVKSLPSSTVLTESANHAISSSSNASLHFPDSSSPLEASSTNLSILLSPLDSTVVMPCESSNQFSGNSKQNSSSPINEFSLPSSTVSTELTNPVSPTSSVPSHFPTSFPLPCPLPPYTASITSSMTTFSPLASTAVVPSESKNQLSSNSQHDSASPVVKPASSSTIVLPESVNNISHGSGVPLRRSQRSPHNSVCANNPHTTKGTFSKSSNQISPRRSSPPPIFPCRRGCLTEMECRIKARTLTARKFLPMSKTAKQQRALMRHLQVLRRKR